MERIAVKSRDLAIVGYDNASSVLEVTFRGGGVYQYRNVPLEIYKGLMSASSHGLYFRDFIKDKYPCVKLK